MMDIKPGGRGTEADVALVRAELSKMPDAIQAKLAAQGIGVIACWESVVDYLPHLATENPRNWDPRTNWTIVPGCYDPKGRNVVIATVATASGARVIPPKGVKHGSWNLVLHEVMHADDYSANRLRCCNSGFVAARNIELARRPLGLTEYESRSDEAGHEETYAESAARFFGSDPTLAASLPSLHSFWSGASLPIDPGPALQRRRRGGAASIGTATLLENGKIELDLRAENDDGVIGHALFELDQTDEGYRSVRNRFAPSGRRSRKGSRTIILKDF
jgi:hypothetical protein